MGYFPNGTSGMIYAEQYCENCVNYGDNNGSGSEGCFVFDLHLLWSSEAANGKDAPKDSATHTKWIALEHFIPTSKDGIGCEQCKMFVPREGVEMVEDKTQAMKEWEAIYGKREEPNA